MKDQLKVSIALAFLCWTPSIVLGQQPVDATSGEIKETKLIARNGSSFAHLGRSVSLSGKTALAGAPDDDQNGTLAGAAHVFVRTEHGWIEQVKLLPSDGEPFQRFGTSVALSDNMAVVGARDDDTNGSSAGAVYVFVRDHGSWTEQAKLLASDGESGDNFGWSVSLSKGTALVGAFSDENQNGRAGAAYVFVRHGGTWTEQAKLVASDGEEGDNFGDSVSVSGDVAVIGSPLDSDNGISAGAAYIFVRRSGTWSERVKLLASDGESLDYFGSAVSISSDERTVLVGAEGDDENGSWSGSAYAFFHGKQGWIESKLLPSDGATDDRFGHSVSVFGNLALISAPDDIHNEIDSGSAYVFRRSGHSWAEGIKLVPSDGESKDRFGESVAVAPGTAVVGARLEDNENGSSAGSVYVFEPSHSVTVAGACPGRLTIEISGAKPESRVALFSSRTLGSDTLDSSLCNSTAVDLEHPVHLATLTTDTEGTFSTTLDLGAGACGLYLQSVDLDDCEFSSVERVPLP